MSTNARSSASRSTPCAPRSGPARGSGASVLSRPRDLTDDALARTLRRGWCIDVTSIKYLPVGFGSHHWAVVDDDGTRWFVTVDENPPCESLCSALATAVALRRAGLTFVVAPVPTSAGDPALVLGNFVVA